MGLFGKRAKPEPKLVPVDVDEFVVVNLYGISIREVDAQEVAGYVQAARENQLRVVPRDDWETYQAYVNEAQKLREAFRNLPAPGPVQSRITMEAE